MYVCEPQQNSFKQTFKLNFYVIALHLILYSFILCASKIGPNFHLREIRSNTVLYLSSDFYHI